MSDKSESIKDIPSSVLEFYRVHENDTISINGKTLRLLNPTICSMNALAFKGNEFNRPPSDYVFSGDKWLLLSSRTKNGGGGNIQDILARSELVETVIIDALQYLYDKLASHGSEPINVRTSLHNTIVGAAGGATSRD